MGMLERVLPALYRTSQVLSCPSARCSQAGTSGASGTFKVFFALVSFLHASEVQE